MNSHKIFCDASFDLKSLRAVGAYLVVFADAVESSEICTVTFSTTNCARAEFLAAFAALKNFKFLGCKKLVLYTDSQTLANLPMRRKKLEANQFISKRSGLKLTNADLYQEFYEVFDRLNTEFEFEVQWVKGHASAQTRTEAETMLSVVDKAARDKLRELVLKEDRFGRGL